MTASIVRCVMSIVALALIVLGVVAIVMGFSYKWPDAQPCGSVFFIGGWLLAGIQQIVCHIEKIADLSAKGPSA